MDQLKRNVLYLMSRDGHNPNSLAAASGAKQPNIFRILEGESNEPRNGTLKPLADYWGVSVPDLKYKDLTGLAGQTLNLLPGPDIRGKLPLISWVKAGEMSESPDNFQPGDAEDWIDCPIPHSNNSYCLRVSGDSMDGEDGYRDGDIIFVDPIAEATPGRDVIVRTPDGKMTFKRLKEDTEGPYLLGLNEKKIISMPKDAIICGVVIFSGKKR